MYAAFSVTVRREALGPETKGDKEGAQEHPSASLANWTDADATEKIYVHGRLLAYVPNSAFFGRSRIVACGCRRAMVFLGAMRHAFGIFIEDGESFWIMRCIGRYLGPCR